MRKRTFSVKAVWDPEAQVYVADSDIEGLHIEAKTADEFEQILMDVAPELIVANHLTAEDLADTPISELVPAILWERPQDMPSAA